MSMTDVQRLRWGKIAEFALDAPGATFLFEDKLIHQTGWPRALARRAITEYRRFLMLASERAHPVSPSPIVDEVWHLHLLYTRSYWDNLCPHVLGFAFHHEPATGTRDDRAHLDDAYARTLSSYRALFNAEPPGDIWPVRPVVRPIARVDPGLCVILPRRAWWIGVGIGAGFGILFLICIAYWILTSTR